MKNIIGIFIVMLIAVGCKDNNKQTTEPEEHNHNHTVESPSPQKKKVLSPHTSAMATIDDAHIHIDYSSPGVRNRMIFGGLLAYDEVWQAGAHNATWIETNKDLVIDGNELKAGKYGFFVIPSQEQWTLIFNTRWNQHGKDEYNTDEDVLRLTVKPEPTKEITEHLTYKIEKTDPKKGKITLLWEKVKVEFPFEVK
ncbi:DUF2911 domain-containing protein [Aquimarina brevivitae]|uniref:DUF2911 family protein n=1 Tax=Aquimarina brevivitae TaxID=323412 RepID=A0A4V2F7H1_9FLAO|nr:DUF2911 domain-containing protein [Aquimarina brevivitae]RZS99799.1 DUF2911 family protein [Aquimarina brevivitae]